MYIVVRDRHYESSSDDYDEAERLATRRAEKGNPCLVVEVKASVRVPSEYVSGERAEEALVTRLNVK